MRQLGIPTVLDRFVQQLLLQVLQPMFDPTFSEHSHGFRPGRRAHAAVCEAQQYIQGGRRWVVDVDLERFFDRVNHDVLMGKLQNRIADRRVLRIIRHYLEAGIMVDGVVMERHEGTPQGGPLSPLLANVYDSSRLQALPQYPSVSRDMALIVDENVTHEQIVEVINGAGQKNLTGIELFDIFRAKGVGEGKKSLAYSLVYRSLERTLTDEDANGYHEAIKNSLKSALKVEIREN